MIERRPIAERVAIVAVYRVLSGVAKRWADEGRTLEEFADFLDRLLEVLGEVEDRTTSER